LLMAALRSASNPAEGLRIAGVAIGCAVLAPALYIEWTVRRRRLTHRYPVHRAERYLHLAFGTACLLVAIALVETGGGPKHLLDCLHAMTSVLAAALVATLAYKVSVHSAAMAGAVIIVGQLFGPVCVALVPLVGLVGWSRVALGAHTRLQVMSGMLIGFVGSIQAYSVYA
jgi:membrane-associated phospholipid phosphatase